MDMISFNRTYCYSTILFVIISSLCSCNRHIDNSFPELSNKYLDSASKSWSEYYTHAYHDRLVHNAREFLEESIDRNDTISAFVSCIYIAQSYLFMDMKDSVKTYTDMADKYRIPSNDIRYEALLNNIEGIYAIKFAFNYSEALSSFRKVLDLSTESNNIPMQILSLSNIVGIYYIRGDRHGIGYAENAYNLVGSLEYDINNRYMYETPVFLSMARMKFLSEDYKSALFFLSKADSLIKEYEILNIKSSVTLLYGDIYSALGNYHKADSCYSESLETANYNDIGLLSQIYLNYGQFHETMKEYTKAIEMYERGIMISHKNHNMLFWSELLKRLSYIYSNIGDSDKAYYYNTRYNRYIDSISLKKLEQDFNALEISYKDIEYKYDLQSKELEIMQAKKNTLIAQSIIIIIVFISIAIYIIYRRQKMMYRKLFENHQKFVQRFNSNITVSKTDNSSDTTEKDLYIKAEILMQEKQIYKQKDLTLDKMAKILDTNRTYLSKAINKFSGMSFSSYLNMYRIKEATRIISDTENDILMKQLSDSLGYSSVPVFSKAFLKETGLSPSKYRKEIMSSSINVDNM